MSAYDRRRLEAAFLEAVESGEYEALAQLDEVQALELFEAGWRAKERYETEKRLETFQDIDGD